MSTTSGNDRVTRATNKSTHPGIPDIDDEVLDRPIPKPRRTKAQVIADNVAAAEKKTAKAEQVKLSKENRAQLVAQIAILEKKMHDEEKKTENEAARPPAKKGVVMVAKFPTKCTHILSFILTCVILMLRNNAATQKKSGPVGKKDKLKNTGNNEGSSGTKLPDFGEALLFMLNEQAGQ